MFCPHGDIKPLDPTSGPRSGSMQCLLRMLRKQASARFRPEADFATLHSPDEALRPSHAGLDGPVGLLSRQGGHLGAA